MISVCCPSRARPGTFAEMAASAKDTARGVFEIVCWLDDDDETADAYPDLPFVRYLHGPRRMQSDLWNRCWEKAFGSIAMLAGDDILFLTNGWDRKIEQVFKRWPDRIGMVYGIDGAPWGNEPTLPFVSREWIDAAGTFTPPYFASWFADRWIWEVAEQIDRDWFCRTVLFEHRRADYRGSHPLKADETYLEARKARNEQDGLALYLSPAMLAERQQQAMRLSLKIHERKR